MTGKTPIEFIRVIRLKHAAKLLRETRMNISEVAYQVGFNNPILLNILKKNLVCFRQCIRRKKNKNKANDKNNSIWKLFYL